MNKQRASAALAALALLCGTSTLAQVSVSSGGTPSFSQGIEVPPGVAGMSPKLGILYAGGGVNGPLGYGWSIQGISSITRCAPTLATDAKRGAVAYSPDDKLCLDGQRLIQTDAAGTALPFPQTQDSIGGATGSTTAIKEYRTEKDSYARIRSYGCANGDIPCNSGPAYFKVWTKSGQVYEYGDGPSKDANTKALIKAQKTVSNVTTTVPMAWAVARISDTLGNAIDFKYEQRQCAAGNVCAWGSGTSSANPTTGSEWNLLEVQYGKNKVVFNYDPTDGRQDKSEAYHLGYKNISARLLSSVTTYSGTTSSNLGASGTPVKTTKLGYSQGPVSKRNRIASIQTCAGADNSTRCMPATSFTYADGGNEVYVSNANFASGALQSLQLQSATGTLGISLGDFNGDGRTDILRWSDNPADNKLYFSQGDGSFTESGTFNLKQPTNTLFHSGSPQCYYTLVTDLNGDGLPDLFRFADAVACPSATPTFIYFNNGDGSFTEQSYSGPQLTRVIARAYGGQSGVSYVDGANFYLMDVDGDGLPDLVTAYYPLKHYMASGIDDCMTQVCNHVYKGDGKGGFKEVFQPNLTVS